MTNEVAFEGTLVSGGTSADQRMLSRSARTVQQEMPYCDIFGLLTQEELKSTYVLWQLFHIDQDLAKAQQGMAKEQKALEAAARTGMVADKEIAAKRKVQAGYHMERINLERQLKRRRTDSEAKVPYNLYMDPRASAWIRCCVLHCIDD